MGSGAFSWEGRGWGVGGAGGNWRPDLVNKSAEIGEIQKGTAGRGRQKKRHHNL